MTNSLPGTRQATLSFVEEMLNQGVLAPTDLRQYITEPQDPFDPESVCQDLAKWYRDMGIESVIGRQLSLSPCPFTRDEIVEAYQQQEIILCVPKGVSRQELGKLFRIDSWALHDPLVTPATEKQDRWFRTSMSLKPSYMNESGVRIRRLFEDEKKLHFSIERYMVFIARIRHLTNHTPDQEYWIWLPRGAYDRSGILIAGFDRYGSFNVHGWMPQFSASFVGARYGFPPKS